MSQNRKKSRRNWEYSGLQKCDDCKKFKYNTWTSLRPKRLTFCQSCWHWIYVQDRKPMSLFNQIEGENS